MNREYWKSYFENLYFPPASVLAGALIVCALIAASVALSIQSAGNTLSVTGSAKTEVTADSVKFAFSVSRTAEAGALSESYAGLDTDLASVKSYLSQNGIEDSEVTIDPVMTNQLYDNNGLSNRYSLSREVTINSSRVDAVTAFAQHLSTLASKGILIQANQPEYYYTKLADLRISLLGDALKDANERASAIAKQSGQGVGRLKSSTSGVVQVLAPNSIDVSDDGQYDTTSIQKEVMITVRATYLTR